MTQGAGDFAMIQRGQSDDGDDDATYKRKRACPSHGVSDRQKLAKKKYNDAMNDFRVRMRELTGTVKAKRRRKAKSGVIGQTMCADAALILMSLHGVTGHTHTLGQLEVTGGRSRLYTAQINEAIRIVHRVLLLPNYGNFMQPHRQHTLRALIKRLEDKSASSACSL